MKFGLKLVLSATLLFVAVGCGPEPDPSEKNNDTNNGQTNNGQTNNGTANNGANNNGTANNGTANNDSNNNDPNNNDPNNNDPNNNDPNTNNETNNAQTNNGTGNNNGGGECVPDTVFFGQIGGDGDHGGGVPSTDALTNDAGLAGLLEGFTAVEGETQTVDAQITEAIVTATNFGTGGNSNFWVQDSGAAMQVFLGFENPVDAVVKVGDAVSFHVTELGNFGGTPQIAVIDGFTVVSSGNAVPYSDKTGVDLVPEDYAKIVRITGTLGAVGTDCGGTSKCYDMVNGTQTLVYRTSSEFAQPGDCVTFVGPLGMFPGPKNDEGTVGDYQLNVANFDWSFTAFE